MFRQSLFEKFTGFRCFPPPAKVALMDMLFNLGETKFSAIKWPRLFLAANLRSWEKAATESHRKGVNQKRNMDTRKQFMEAEEMEINAQNNDPDQSP